MFHNFIQLLFPKHCLHCETLISPQEHGFCLECWQDIPLNTDEIVFNKFTGRIPLQHAKAFYQFKDKNKAQLLVHDIKYQHNLPLAHYVGKQLGAAWKKELSTIDCLVPIPMHRKKQWKRGFNQALELAEGIKQSSHCTIRKDLLVRKRHQKSQTQKSRNERFEALSDLYLAPLNAQGLHIGLIDDVITTGATIEHCANALFAQGAASISLFCLANAVFND